MGSAILVACGGCSETRLGTKGVKKQIVACSHLPAHDLLLTNALLLHTIRISTSKERRKPALPLFLRALLRRPILSVVGAAAGGHGPRVAVRANNFWNSMRFSSPVP